MTKISDATLKYKGRQSEEILTEEMFIHCNQMVRGMAIDVEISVNSFK